MWHRRTDVPKLFMISCHSSSVADTHGIAAAIAGIVRPRDLIVLSGEMGAGKTAFAAGFAQGLGVTDDDHVSSPTFTLVHTYASGRLPLHHADLYRLTSTAEVADLGLRELVDLGAVALVEWGDVAGDVLGDVFTVALEADDDNDDDRHITIYVDGHSWDTRWEQLRHVLRPWSFS